MSKEIVLVGAGGFGREVLAWAEKSFPDLSSNPVVGFLDDNSQALAGFDCKVPYLGGIENYLLRENEVFLLGIANPLIKKKVVGVLRARGAKFISLVHPSAVVASSASIGEGVIICPFALVSANTRIDDFVTINVMSSIGHDSKVGEYSTLSGHVDITGQITVGKNVFFGTGAKLLPRISVGDDAVVGAGCTVVRSVLTKTTIYTSPAKRLGTSRANDV